jgi:ABC-type dipeptide/oligopeptide/nickel transport system ATPase subunit
MLDVSTQANIIALLRRVMAPSNGAMMIISHDREMVEYLCDQIYVFDQYTLKKEIET